MIYAYGRVSTDKQENSLNLQQNTNNEFCKRLFGQLPDVELYDEDVSAKKRVTKRPKGAQLENIQPGDKIICMKHDRMFRNIVDGILMVRKWVDMKVSVYFINLGDIPIDTNNPEKKFQFNIMLCTAEYERDVIGKRTKDGMRQRKKDFKSYSKEVYGYNNIYDRNEKGDRINGRMVPNEEEQRVITVIKKMKEDHYPLRYIADHLNENKITTKAGRKWSAKTIRDVLINDIHDLKNEQAIYRESLQSNPQPVN